MRKLVLVLVMAFTLASCSTSDDSVNTIDSISLYEGRLTSISGIDQGVLKILILGNIILEIEASIIPDQNILIDDFGNFSGIVGTLMYEGTIIDESITGTYQSTQHEDSRGAFWADLIN